MVCSLMDTNAVFLRYVVQSTLCVAGDVTRARVVAKIRRQELAVGNAKSFMTVIDETGHGQPINGFPL